MGTAQRGDRVLIHFVKRMQDGSVFSSRGHTPLEMTVGIDHPRLPGLGLALVDLRPGASLRLRVPPEKAYGLSDPHRIRRFSHKRFPEQTVFLAGSWARLRYPQNRYRWVRILEVKDREVVVDTDNRWSGQAMELEVELLAIQEAYPAEEKSGQETALLPVPTAALADGVYPGTVVTVEGVPLPRIAGAVAFNLDHASLATLQAALSAWEIQVVPGATTAALLQELSPAAADFLVIGANADEEVVLQMCRGLRRQEGLALIPLLVMVPPGKAAFVRSALDAGAYGCLILQTHSADEVSMSSTGKQLQ